MRMAISRLNHLIDFGVTETVPTDTLEGSEEKFVPQQTLHFAYYQLSITQRFQLANAQLANSTIVAVRKQYHVSEKLLAKIHGDDALYKIVSISRDESHSPIGYDLITLQNIKEVGNANA